MGKTKKSIRGRAGRKTRKARKLVTRKLVTRKLVTRKLVTRKLVSGKNKKTHRKGKKQTGGRRRPNGLGTGGVSSVSPNNGAMNEGGQDYLNEADKVEAIRLIKANNTRGLIDLLDGRTFPDDKALLEAVKTPGVNMETISEVIFRTYIHDDTEDKISAAMEKTPDLLIEVIDALKEQELRQQEAAALARAIESSAKNNGRPVTPPPPMENWY